MRKLDLALILMFVLLFFLGLLSLQIFYLLFVRRRFWRTSFGDSELATVDNGCSRETFRSSSYSKELIGYLLCCKRQSQVKPTCSDGGATEAEADKAAETPSRGLPASEEAGEEEEYDLEKLSRLLYTIKEDERGETASSISDRSEKEPEVQAPATATTPFDTPMSSPVLSIAGL